ncbi:response regulator [Iningainema tapete]|uniref:Response regulator n=1 Tax=Iningainema tapete BLCC-T55 TaxID=2748662 RepID=A0A8J6XJ60_9CYAN|nr:response regulator [Iningainema tapete]MBD2775463.1 response regulator [Iningainema tapete BLCC-T55]
MKTLPIGRYRFFQSLQPLALLTKITSQQNTGCLQVYSSTATWLFYLEKGKLIYACYADNMFNLLYKNLQQLSQKISTLHPGIYQQLQAIFETGIEHQAIPNPDYLAICWLVNQRHLNLAQAGTLIERLALEVLEPFLRLKEGSYEFSSESFLDDMPKFCHLDLLLLAENFQKQYKSPENSDNQKVNHRFQVFQGRSPSTQSKKQPPLHSAQQVYQHPFNKKYTVFCIDDSPIIINTIKCFLDEQIFTFVGVNDPVKSLMQIIRVKPDIILLDIEMPNLDGYELCSLLRKHSYFQNTPIIMVTGRTGLIDRARAKLVKASGYLTKPFTQADLLKIAFQYIK